MMNIVMTTLGTCLSGESACIGQSPGMDIIDANLLIGFHVGFAVGALFMLILAMVLFVFVGKSVKLPW